MGRVLVILAVLAALCATTFLWTLGTAESPADFTFVNRGELRTLDPNRMSWLEDIRIGYALWEGLYALEPKTLEPIPGAASEIDLTPDRRGYTFHIRPEARWSNGDPLKAGDFVFAWRRMLEHPGDYSYLFSCIRGARQYQQAYAVLQQRYDKEKPGRWSVTSSNQALFVPDPRPTGDAEFASVEIAIPDDKTLVVSLDSPVPYFPDLCAFPPFWPLHEPSMREFWNDQTHAYDTKFTRPPYLVTNGPFRLTKWEFRRRMRLEANPNYWDIAHVKSRVIEVLPAEDAMWGFLKYESGAADWLPDAAGAIGAELWAQKRPDLHVYPAFGTYFYTLNCREKFSNGTPNPLADVRVRLALSMAVDRRSIVQTITRLGEQSAGHFIPVGVFPTYHSPPGVEYDPKRAAELLAAAGYPGGRGFPAIGILFNTEFHHGDVAQMIRRQWLENLGIDVGLEGVEVKLFRQRLQQKDYAIARASWYGDYNDPSTFTDKYRSTSENNDAGWISKPFDQLCDAALAEPDSARRMDLFRQAEQLLLQQQPIIPLYHTVNVCLFRPNIKGLELTPRNMVQLKSVYVEKPDAAGHRQNER